MKHRKVPRWVTVAMAASKDPPWGPPVKAFQMLSEVTGSIELRCDLCQRHGRYRAERLLADLGDLPMPELLVAVARRAGCNRALHPPTPGDVLYNDHVCKVRRYYPKHG